MLNRTIIWSILAAVCGQLLCMQSNENMRCSICQDDLCSCYVTTSCGHNFHGKCLATWQEYRWQEGKLSSCPNCRTSPVAEQPPVLPLPVLEELPPLPTVSTPRRQVLRGWLFAVLGTRRASGSENSSSS